MRYVVDEENERIEVFSDASNEDVARAWKMARARKGKWVVVLVDAQPRVGYRHVKPVESPTEFSPNPMVSAPPSHDDDVIAVPKNPL